MPSDEGHWVYFLLGRPIMAVPASSRRLRRAAWRYYAWETPNRRRFKRAMRLIQALGLDRLWGRRLKTPPLPNHFNFLAWMEQVREHLGRSDLHAAIVWPPPARSTARVYVHILTDIGERVAFAKLTFDAYESERILCESRALAQMPDTVKFRVPRILGEGQTPGGRYLLAQSLPDGTKRMKEPWPFVRDQVMAGYAGPPRLIPADQLQKLAWWLEFRLQAAQAGGADGFLRELDQLDLSQAPVCRVHGDLAPHNMARCGDEVWVFDWEEACDTAPILTDEVRFYLSLNRKRILGNPVAALPRIHTDFSMDSPARRRDVMFALAFLYGARMTAAEALVHHWTAR